MRKKEETYNVPGLEKGLQIIELLVSKQAGLTLQDIVKSVDVTVTTAYRILSTLVRMEYASYDERSKNYTLTRKILRLGYQKLGEHDLMEHLLPALRALRDEVKESVFYGVLGEDKGVCIEQAQGIHPFKFVLEPGASFDLHTSAPGKALLAFAAPETRGHYLKKISYVPCTRNTITDLERYIGELERVRETGYATDMEETFIGVICIGAPVFDYDGTPVGAVWVSGPDSRITDKDYIIDRLLNTTRALSLKMGYAAG